METAYYFCPVDNYGQRTGQVIKINLKSAEIRKDKYGNKYSGNKFLYESKLQAIRAALN